MRKQRTELRHAKLPPILEIDEDGVPVTEMENWDHGRWAADEGAQDLSLGMGTPEFDD